MDNIAALVAEAREQPLPSFIPRSEIIRELAEPARFNLVEIITGMRRSGKTFYLYQKMSQLLEAGVPRDRLFYFDFADDRLSPLAPDTMASVIEEFWRQVPEARTEGCYLFLDEVQEMERWQGVCQRLAEHEKVTLVITGSSSKLSSEEIATKFRGRSHSHEMLPLSFREFCLFQAVEGDRLKGPAFSPQTQTFLEGLFDRYLTEGGFPGVQNRLNEDRIELLQSYVRDVVAQTWPNAWAARTSGSPTNSPCTACATRPASSPSTNSSKASRSSDSRSIGRRRIASWTFCARPSCS